MNPAFVPPLHSAAWFRGYFFGTAHQRGDDYYPHLLASKADLRAALIATLDYIKENTP